MTGQEKAVLNAVIEALDVPRDRLGRLVTYGRTGEKLRALALPLGLPHGGADRVDQAVMALQAICGRKIESILDKDTKS